MGARRFLRPSGSLSVDVWALPACAAVSILTWVFWQAWGFGCGLGGTAGRSEAVPSSRSARCALPVVETAGIGLSEAEHLPRALLARRPVEVRVWMRAGDPVLSLASCLI